MAAITSLSLSLMAMAPIFSIPPAPFSSFITPFKASPFLFPPLPSKTRTIPPTIIAQIRQSHKTLLSEPSQTLTLDQKLVVAGGHTLFGHVPISGSKNSALAVLAGTLCCNGASKLKRIPDLFDTRTMVTILRSLGARVDFSSDGEMVVDAGGICSLEPCTDAVGRIRAGFFVIGPLLGRFGEAEVALPGGCDIGSRPVDLFVRGLRALGALVEFRQGKVYARANGKRLTGGKFHLDYPSVGASETLMMAASLADGETVLSNVAQEPEVVDLARFLIASGADIKGEGTGVLVIKGKRWLHGPEFTVIPDRIEAGTFMAAASITCSCISMSPVLPCHLTCVTDKLVAAGCKITQRGSHTLEVSVMPGTVGGLRAFDFKTCPYPGFPTDLQPLFMALLTTCNGSSIVEESVFEGRMNHVKELRKLGARIQVCESTTLVSGKDEGSVLSGSSVKAMDLRGGAAMVLAGLAAEGITEIAGVNHIDRGYENLEGKLRGLGAVIRRQTNSKTVEL